MSLASLIQLGEAGFLVVVLMEAGDRLALIAGLTAPAAIPEGDVLASVCVDFC
jgi:hypothetical protein